MKRHRRAGLAVVVATAVLVAGCGSDGDDPEPEPSTAPPTSPAAAPTETPTPEFTPEPVQFVYKLPDEAPCPTVNELVTIPLGGEGPYQLVDPLLIDRDGSWKLFCTYALDELVDADDDHYVLADHIRVSAEIALYPEWSDSTFSGRYHPIPLGSDHREAWAKATLTMDRGIWREGCDGAPCDDGETPNERTHGWEATYLGHVGNLEFYVHVLYIAEQLPDDPETTTRAVFEELAEGIIDQLEQVE